MKIHSPRSGCKYSYSTDRPRRLFRQHRPGPDATHARLLCCGEDAHLSRRSVKAKQDSLFGSLASFQDLGEQALESHKPVRVGSGVRANVDGLHHSVREVGADIDDREAASASVEAAVERKI